MRETSNAERVRLASWKAIASFLGRDERTVQRWEKEHRLPIHRLPGERGGVFAYKDELLEWLQPSEDNAQGGTAVGESGNHGFEVSRTERQPTAPKPLVGDDTGSKSRVRALWAGLAACSVLGIAVAWGAHSYWTKQRVVPSAVPASAGESAKASRGDIHTENAQAREFYLSGTFFANQRTRESLLKAAEAFKKAIHEDSGFGNAYTGLAQTYELMPEFGAMPSSEAFPEALVAAKQAVMLDGESPDAHRVLAFVLFYWEWKTRSAFTEFDRAIALDPRDAQTHHWYANALMTVRRSSDAAKEIEIARELDPTAKAILADQILIESLHGVGDPRYVAELHELSRAEPTFISPMRYASWLLYQSKQYSLWVDELQTIASATHDPVDISIARAATTGWKNGERELLLNVLKAEEGARGSAQISDVELGSLCLRAGDVPAALRFLQAAYTARDFRLLVLVSQPADPLLRGNPEYETIQDQVRANMSS